MRNFYKLNLAAVSATVLATASPAFAQGAPGASETAEAAAETANGGLGDIVVTARRRDEALQDVPIAITALSNQDLERQGVRSAEDLRNVAPGVNIAGLSRDKADFFVRGQGPGSLTSLSRNVPGVAVYFAEVPTEVAGPGFFHDLASVQVLKGPQGTLFGRNTTGGAVLLEPNRPDWDNGGFAQVQLGNYDLRQFNGVVNVAPVPDRFAIRLAAEVVRRDGFTRSIITGQRQDERAYEAFRASFRFSPSDSFDNVTIIDYRFRDQAGTGQVTRAIDPSRVLGGTVSSRLSAAQLAGFAAASGLTAAQVGSIPLSLGGAVSVACLNPAAPGCGGGAALGANLRAAFASAQARRGGLFLVAPTATIDQILATQAQIGPRRNQNNFLSRNKEKTVGVVNRTNWDLSDTLRIKNVISFRKTRSNEIFNFTGSPLPILNALGPFTPGAEWQAGTETFTEELQLQGQFESLNLSYIIGGYYEKAKPGFLQSSTGQQVGNLGPRQFVYNDSSRAVFGHLEWNPLEWLSLAGGVRRTRDAKDLEQSVFGPTGACNSINLLTGTIQCPLLNSAKFKATTYDGTISIKPTNDLLFYAAYRHGYKAGGLNVPIAPGPATDPLFYASYAPEFVDDFEIGAKMDFDIGIPVRINVAAFKDDYKDQQIPVNVPYIAPNGNPQAASAIQNLTTSSIKGFEGQISFKPVPILTLGGFGSYLKAVPDETLRDPVTGSIVVIADRQAQRQPRYKYGLNAALDIPLQNDNGRLLASIDYSWQSKFFAATLPTLVDVNPSYGVANARVGWDSVMGSDVDIALFANNAFGKTYVLGGYPVITLGFDSAIYGEPRMYGMSVKLRFGSMR